MSKKLYAVTDKNGNPRQFGNCRKSTWSTPRWVNYHIGGRGYNRNLAERYDVQTIDFETNTISKI